MKGDAFCVKRSFIAMRWSGTFLSLQKVKAHAAKSEVEGGNGQGKNFHYSLLSRNCQS